MLQERHIEIRSPGIAQNISAGIAKRQAGWKHERRRVVEKRSKAIEPGGQRAAGSSVIGIAYEVGVRAAGGEIVADAGIVRGCVDSLVVDTERRSALNQGKAKPWPPTKGRG